MIERLTRRRVLGGLALGSLAGCGQTPSPALYVLVPRPGTSVVRPLPTIALRTVEIPKYLDRPQIVRHRSDIELAAADFERWAEGFDDMVTRVLLEDLALRLPASQVTVVGSAVTAQAQTTVAVDIARFDSDPDGTVVLEARWAIRRGELQAAVRLERISAAAGSNKTADLVSAMSDCLAQLSDRLAQALAG